MVLKSLKPRIAACGGRLTLKPAAARERLRGRPWARIRSRIMSRDPLCVACLRVDRVRATAEVDHIVPVEKGGSDDDSNLQGLCHGCHAEKTASEQRARFVTAA